MGNLLCGESPPSGQQLINAIRKAGHSKKVGDHKKAVYLFEDLMDGGDKDFLDYIDDVRGRVSCREVK